MLMVGSTTTKTTTVAKLLRHFLEPDEKREVSKSLSFVLSHQVSIWI